MRGSLLFITSILAIGAIAGCQTTQPQDNSLVVASATEQPAPADVEEYAEKETKSVSDPDYDPDEIICKTVKRTGSRIAKGKDCRTAKQWRDTMTNSQRAMGDITNKHRGAGLSE